MADNLSVPQNVRMHTIGVYRHSTVSLADNLAVCGART